MLLQVADSVEALIAFATPEVTTTAAAAAATAVAADK